MNFSGDAADFNRRFWSAYAKELTGKMGQDAPKGYDPNVQDSSWLIIAAQGQLAQFTDMGGGDDDDDDTAATSELQRFNGAVYDYANRLPGWSTSWTGESDGDFFETYADIVRQLSPKNPNPAALQTITDLKTQLIKFEDDIKGLQRQFEADYKQDNMTGNTWNDGFNASTMKTDFVEYKKTDDYQQKLQILSEAASFDRLAIGDQIMKAQEACYGTSFPEISGALKKVNLGDPMVTTDPDVRVHYQMQIADGSGLWVPDYTSGPDNTTGLDNYKKWLSATQAAFDNKAAPNVSFTMQQNEIDTASSEVKTESSASLPFADIFVGSAGESTDTKKNHIEKEDFEIAVSMQDIHFLPVTPGVGWYDEGVLKFATAEYLPADSIYLPQPANGSTPATPGMSGPTGNFNLRVIGVLIGIGRSVTYSSSHYAEDDWSQDIDVHASCSLLGIISIGGGDYHSHAETSVKVTEGQGFTIADTTNAPTVLGVVVQQIPVPAA